MAKPTAMDITKRMTVILRTIGGLRVCRSSIKVQKCKGYGTALPAGTTWQPRS